MKVAPSILSADFAELKDQLALVKDADWLHFDVMDGHFVPNISFGPMILESIKPHTDLFMDVHLMIDDPMYYADAFIKAGADLIVFHYEVANDEKKIIEMVEVIKSKGVQVGIAIKPKTSIDTIQSLLHQIDVLLIMSVEPGFGGQAFMIEALEKIKQAKAYITKHQLSCLVEVDGGINEETAKQCKAAGADVLVAGSYIFKAKDMAKAIESLR